MRLFLFLLLISCGVNTEKKNIPVKDNDRLELNIEHKDFKPLEGNENLFAGLLCASGEKQFCNYCYDNITSTGNFCRNKSKVTEEKCADLESSFSYDEFLGISLFIITNKDTKLANKLYSFIQKNNYNLCDNPISDECLATPPVWDILKISWKNIGMQPNERMLAGSVVGYSWQKLAANNVAVSYRTHLIAVYLYINRLTNTWNDNLQDIANILTRRQPNNLFMQYLTTGTFDKQLFLQRYYERTSKLSQWHQQRADEEKAWKQSVGWDFQFLINLYNKKP